MAKKSAALARLAETIEVKNGDGSVTMVPVSSEDNATLNKILASQMRALIQRSIDKFGGMDHLTPKELKELTEAARNVAEFSGEVYKTGESINDGQEKAVDVVTSDPLDFKNLKVQTKDGSKSEESSKPSQKQEVS